MSEPNYHTTKFFIERLLAIEMKKQKRLLILDLSKILMYECWYDYLKPKYSEEVKLCYMDTDIFIAHIKTDDIYKDIAEDVESRFNTSSYEVERLLPVGKNLKVIGLMKDELGKQIMKKSWATTKNI